MLTIVPSHDAWSALDLTSVMDPIEEALAAETGDARLGREAILLLTNDAEVHELNRQWRGKDKPTNVLSFPADEIPGLPANAQPLGDLALAYETCIQEAGGKRIAAKDHATHLIVHGLLHLLGYDHIDEGEAEAMEDLERRILKRLGISDPYAESA